MNAKAKPAVDKAVDTLQAQPKVLAITLQDDSEVLVYRCRVKHIGAVVRLIRSILASLGITDFTNVKMSDLEKKISDAEFILNLISNSVEDFSEAIASLTSLDKDKFDELELDDAMIVIKKVLEVNYDFFINSVLPKVNALLQSGSDSNPLPEQSQ